MSSLTRARATNTAMAPTALHATYYGQRASAGLILTESTWISKNAVSFAAAPGIYTDEQINGWKEVTTAVHEKGGKIFLQIVHSGSVSHSDYFDGKLPAGPSAINPKEKVFTAAGFKDTETPTELTKEEISTIIQEFKIAAQNAKTAGFDGIELHAQIFTLIPQFLSAATNIRTDEYGGSIENRSRILFEILDVLKEVYTSTAIGVKFTPAAFNTGIIQPDQDTIPLYSYILKQLNDYQLGYLHLVAPAVDLAGTVLESIRDNYFSYFREIYKGTLMANGGFDFESANQIIHDHTADLVAFGRLYIANPDLAERFENHLDLAEADTNTFYMGEEKGYTDYPFAK